MTLSSGVPINSALLSRLIEERFGSLHGFADHWAERVESGLQRKGKAKSYKSVHRWLTSEAIPSNTNDVFGFAATLDIDPVAIMALSRELVERRFPEERYILHHRRDAKSALRPFHDLYRLGLRWPDNRLAQAYYGRDWHIVDFSHDAKSLNNVYVALFLEAGKLGGGGAQDVPRAYHFAYRKARSIDRFWRPFGTVIGYRGRTVLVHENGNFQEVGDLRSPSTVLVETFFGPSASEFRVVSIHPYDLQKPRVSSEERIVRFDG